MPLGGAGAWKKSLNQTKKVPKKIKGKGLGTQPQKRPHHLAVGGNNWLVQTSWAILTLRWEDKLAVLCAKADKMLMRIV